MEKPATKNFGGSWSDNKLDVIKDYLASYGKALEKQSFRRIYIDAFAGAGQKTLEWSKDEELFDDKAIKDEDQLYRHGSPLIALASEPKFHRFVFIDQDKASLYELEKQVLESGFLNNRKVDYVINDANVALQAITNESWVNQRAVAFLDPFALHVRWSTIQSIAKTKAIDMWLLFPAMAVNRMLPRSGLVPPAWEQRLNETFGDGSWRDVFYKTEEPNLFGEEHLFKVSDVFTKLSEYVTRRLKSEFAGVHETPLILRNSTGAPIFLLCFASGNPRGALIAKRIAQHIINKKSHG